MDAGPRLLRLLSTLSLLTLLAHSAYGQLTVYNTIPLYQQRILEAATATANSTAAQLPEASPTLAAYDSTRLIPPALPQPLPATTFTLELPRDAGQMQGLSIPHVGGGFYGFSIEMSVLSQIVGKNSTHLQVPFLNLIANIVERAGTAYLRWGGNTQEYARLVPETEHDPGRTFGKTKSGSLQTTDTPAVTYTVDMLYMAGNVSKLTNAKFYFGIPFDVIPFRLEIAELAQNLLGDSLLALQAGNEPDLYGRHHKRPFPYTPQMYNDELHQLLAAIDANPRIPIKNKLIGPSVASTDWGPIDVWNTGYMDIFNDRIYAYAVERYLDNNCAVAFNNGGRVVDPQENFWRWLTHATVVEFVEQYRDSATRSAQHNRPFIMFETNTGSCGGFPGISNVYGAALWATDYGMRLASVGFDSALLHIGGQNVYYNPFTAPPTNQTGFNEWTVGPVYYSAIIMAEAFGKSNQSRIVDLGANNNNPLTPAYAIYDQGTLSRMALFNYMDDVNAPGTANINVQIRVPNGGPSQVYVKYLASDSVSSQNITWAGQTFGHKLTSDGRFKGELKVETITCTDVCNIPVPAPGFALVLFNSQDPPVSVGQAPKTFATTAYTKLLHTAAYDLEVLETSNGQSAKDRKFFGATSPGSAQPANGASYASPRAVIACASVVVAGLSAGWVLFSHAM